MSDSPSPSGPSSPYEMVKSIELRKFLDIAEKEGIIYNKLKIRQGRVDEYQDDIEKNAFLLNNKPYDVPCIFQIWV